MLMFDLSRWRPAAILRLSRKGALLLLFMLHLALSQVALADPFLEKLADPAGREQAIKLSEAFNAVKGNVKDPAFMKLFLADPKVSKRAFVALVVQVIKLAESNPESAKAAGELSMILANLISEQFGDDKPLAILKAIVSNSEGAAPDLVAYLEAHRPPVAAATPSEGKGQVPPPPAVKAPDTPAAAMSKAEEEAIIPFIIKIVRMDLASVMANPNLLIKELDTYPQVAAEVAESLRKLGRTKQEIDTLNSGAVQEVLALGKLTVLAEVGLLDEFHAGSRKWLVGANDPMDAASVLLSGFRAAYRQNRSDLAKDYARQARALLSQPAAPFDPVLEYALRTSEYQLRLLEGFQPTETQTLAEFDKAWSALESYRALTNVDHEDKWYWGRLATRFWVEELARHPASGALRAKVILTRLAEWGQAVDSFDRYPNRPNTDYAIAVEKFAFLRLTVALADQLAYVMESFPEARQDIPETYRALALLTTMADKFVSLPTELQLERKEPGFPPYDIASGGFVPEIKARTRYLESFLGDLSQDQRASKVTEAVQLIGKTQNPDATVDYLLKFGSRLSLLGQPDQAVAAWKEALAIADKLSFVRRSLQATSLLAQEYSRRQDWTNASLYADRANKMVAATAPIFGISSPESKELAKQSQLLTAISVKSAVEADHPEKALVALDQSRQVQSAAVQMDGQTQARGEAQEVAKKEEQVVVLAQEVARLEAMPSSQTRNSLLESTQNLLADTKTRFLTESRTLRQKHSELYSKVLRFDPLNLPDIQKSLPADVAVVQYFPTEDSLYIFLVTHEVFRLRQVAVSEKSLDASVISFVRAIRRINNSDPALAQDSQKLYQALLAPIQDDIASSQTLVLIPTGRLNSLPFACLASPDGKMLGESKNLLELAKPTDLMRVSTEAPKPISSVVAFANATGDLPSAGKEGERIAAMFPDSKLFSGKQATKEAFIEFGGKAQALHLATHGEWNTTDSLANYLAMAGNQKVAQDEIFSLALEDTSIVILSACNTAMGDGGDVKYVASLAEAFWIAGSHSVVASLWAVDDESTSLLMTEFYKSLKAGDGKAEGLRKAQMAVRANPKFAHPYYWAGFILFGDWR